MAGTVLPAGTLLGYGSEGNPVRRLQESLNDRRPNFRTRPLVIDGIFGPKTEKAVKRFQGANDLVVDGIAGPKTLAVLGFQCMDEDPAPDPPDVPAPEPDPDLDGGYMDRPDKQMPWLGLIVLIAAIITVLIMAFASI